jgi:hypothetical protein
MASLVYAFRRREAGVGEPELMMWVLNYDEEPPPDFEVMVQHSLPSEAWAFEPDCDRLRKLYPCTIRTK